MKKILVLFSVLILSWLLGFAWITGGLATSAQQQSDSTAAIIPQPIVQEMIDQVSQERVLADLRRFTGEEPICTTLNGCNTLTDRYTGSTELQWAKDYIQETLLGLHYSVEVLDWNRDGYTDQNILAHKQGILYPNEQIYFIAHLDGYPHDNPAADDDGSGAVALLELARILANRSLSRSVTLFFSTGEEQGSKGSHQFVADYPDRLGSIKYLVSVEMLGYDSNSDGRMELWSGDTNTEFQLLLANIVDAYPLNLIPQVITGCT